MSAYASIIGHLRQSTAASADYGVWTNHRIPDDRSAWHPSVRQFYEYWRKVSPPGRIPGRQHIAPEDIVPLLSKIVAGRYGPRAKKSGDVVRLVPSNVVL